MPEMNKIMKSRPVGLEATMWAQPVKQGELKKKGQKGNSVALSLLTSRGPFGQELEDSLVHPSIRYALLFQEANCAYSALLTPLTRAGYGAY